MGAAALPLAIGGAVVSAGSSLLSGFQQSKAAGAQANMEELQAEQLAQNAGQERATAQQRAIQERRQARLASSRNQAISAASGGDAMDPSALAINEGVVGQGEYNALTALYQGEAKAQGMEADSAAMKFQSRQTRKAGKNAMFGSMVGAAGSLLSGTGSALLYKYG